MGCCSCCNVRFRLSRHAKSAQEINESMVSGRANRDEKLHVVIRTWMDMHPRKHLAPLLAQQGDEQKAQASKLLDLCTGLDSGKA